MCIPLDGAENGVCANKTQLCQLGLMKNRICVWSQLNFSWLFEPLNMGWSGNTAWCFPSKCCHQMFCRGTTTPVLFWEDHHGQCYYAAAWLLWTDRGLLPPKQITSPPTVEKEKKKAILINWNNIVEEMAEHLLCYQNFKIVDIFSIVCRKIFILNYFWLGLLYFLFVKERMWKVMDSTLTLAERWSAF